MRNCTVLLCLSLLASSAIGCGSDKEDQRRVLLKPPDMRQKLITERAKKTLFDPLGNLLPSGEITAGVNMPKGMRLYRSFENEWYFEARNIPMPALDRYFAARVDPLGIERNATSVTFQDAMPRDTNKARRVTIRIGQLIGADPVCDVYVRQAAPPRAYPSEQQAEAQMEARRKHAD
jgi:hypothetical protein